MKSYAAEQIQCWGWIPFLRYDMAAKHRWVRKYQWCCKLWVPTLLPSFAWTPHFGPISKEPSLNSIPVAKLKETDLISMMFHWEFCGALFSPKVLNQMRLQLWFSTVQMAHTCLIHITKQSSCIQPTKFTCTHVQSISVYCLCIRFITHAYIVPAVSFPSTCSYSSTRNS